MTGSLPTPETYPDLLATLTARIRDARLRTVVSVNRELILLDSQIGRHRSPGPRLQARFTRHDLPFPGNLNDVRRVVEAWPDRAILQQLVAHRPWGHDIRLLEALKQPEYRAWYACHAVGHAGMAACGFRSQLAILAGDNAPDPSRIEPG